MARRKRILASDSSGDDDVNLTPMLDVVFILLIFFIVTAQFINNTVLSQMVYKTNQEHALKDLNVQATAKAGGQAPPATQS